MTANVDQARGLMSCSAQNKISYRRIDLSLPVDGSNAPNKRRVFMPIHREIPGGWVASNVIPQHDLGYDPAPIGRNILNGDSIISRFFFMLQRLQ